MKSTLAICVVLVLAPLHALADDEAKPASVDEPSAADVAGAPVPGLESGRVDSGPEPDSPLRTAGRAALFVPRGLFEVVMFPIRASIWALDRYDVPSRLHDLFFSEGGRVGVYPHARFESGFGLLVGLGLGARLTESERLKLFAGAGGRYRTLLKASIRSGGRADRLDRYNGRLALQLDGEYEQRPEDRFFGIGNGDEVVVPEMPIDPLVDDTAVETRYRDRRARARATADVLIAGELHLRGGLSVTDEEVSRSSNGPPIDEVYMTDSLVGFGDLQHGYAELALRWDSRGRAVLWEPYALDSTGWLAAVYAGGVAIDEGSNFWRYGVDLQKFFRVDEGPRVLAARFHGEGVTGDREDVPFFELPALGGESLLRGYQFDRFRDRVAAVGSVEYQWDLSQIFYASLFVDVGRVYPGLDDLTLSGLRCGFGTSLEAHTARHFRMRISLASSIDGGAFLTLTLDPVFDIDTRLERR